MATPTTEDDRVVLQNNARDCKLMITGIVPFCSVRMAPDLDKVIAQLGFIQNTTIDLTKKHWNCIYECIDDLRSAVAERSTSHGKKRKNFEEFFMEWMYRFDRYWFLLGLYFRLSPLQVGNGHAVVQTLQKQTQRLSGSFILDTSLGDGLLVSSFQGIPNSTLRFKAHQDLAPSGLAILDGHAQLPTEDAQVPNPLGVGKALASKLSMANSFAKSPMDSVGCLESTEAAGRSTPLCFQVATEVGRMSTLRTQLERRGLKGNTGVSIAKDLAKAVHGFHVCDVQHGNLMSDCVLIVNEDEYPETFLHGFQCVPSRNLVWKTSPQSRWTPDTFSSDDTQGRWASIVKDIRNLGVCLLEIDKGYNSLVTYSATSGAPGELWTLSERKSMMPREQSNFVDLARAPKNYGSDYREAVEACFTLGNDMLSPGTPADCIDLSVLFVEHVLMKLCQLPDDIYGEMGPDLWD